MYCDQCPRHCHVERGENIHGFCGVGSEFSVARVALHPWEEPPISGTNGSGTIFFCGCNLRCVFCQNRDISRGNVGEQMSAEQLRDAMLSLQERGAHNINLVTPSHYTNELAVLLASVKPQLKIPVVWNSSSYESAESLRRLDGLVDIYLPDFKYYSAQLAASYSAAPDYFDVSSNALREMLRQTGMPSIDDNGLMVRGVIVRHLILPACRTDSIDILHALHEQFGADAFLLSLMGQYTPDFAQDVPYPNLKRRLTTFEYDSVQRVANDLGFVGFSQALTSASASFTPKFK